MSNITEVVTRMIAHIVKCDSGTLTEETRLAEELMLKSVSRMELAALLEDQFNITVSNFDVLKAKTVGDVIRLVNSKI